jgi:exonuclease III
MRLNQNALTSKRDNINKNKNKTIKICHLNINRLSAKTADINLLLSSYNISILCLTETWLSLNLPTTALFLSPLYNTVRFDRPNVGGGVLVLINKSFIYEVENTLLSPNVELVHVSVKWKYVKTIHVITVYRPPSSNIDEFMKELGTFLNNIDYMSIRILILGDFNINLLDKQNSNTKKFTSFLKSYHMSLCNTNSPTRVTFSSATQIDLNICNATLLPYIYTTRML